MSTKNVKSSTHNANNASSSKLNSSKVTATVTSQSVTETETAGNVNIPLIRSKDIAKQLPVFAAALQRANDDALAVENLDSIQLELEKLLSNVALRYRILKTEYDSLDRDEKRNERRAKQAQSNSEKAPKSPDSAAASGSNAAAMGKRKREENNGNISMQRKSKHGSSFTHKHAKYGKSSSSMSQNNEDSLDYVPNAAGAQATRDNATMPKLALPKNDVPNKFWLSIEPYCMPLTNEDLRLIDELLEQYSGPLVPPIPDLGPHYSDVWAQEDVKELQQVGSANNQRGRTQNHDANALLKKAETLMDDCVTGPLTQRLVTALMEEQLLPDTNITGSNENQSNNVKPEAHIGTPLRSLSMLRNCIGIEQRIKKELVEQGILDVSDLGPNGDENEISNEIKRLITELTAIADYNSSALKRLRESAVEEIKRLEIKRKLDTIDQEIMEAYKRSIQNKVKRKPLSAEDQQEIFRLTAEQKKLSDHLERAQVKPFLYE